MATFVRTLLRDFILANRLYSGCRLYVYEADTNGLRTDVLAQLWDSRIAGESLANPQTLDNEGKNAQPIYFDERIVWVVDGLSEGTNESGVIEPNVSSASIDAAAALAARTVYFARQADSDAADAAAAAAAAISAAAASALARSQVLKLLERRLNDYLQIAANFSDVGDAAIALTNLGLGGLGFNPGGRLTLATGVPVMTADVAAGNTVYYTPSNAGQMLPIWNGARWIMVPFAEVSQLTTDATKSPAAVANNSNYDVLGWLDGTTFRATRGPAWASDTTRGVGAGTAELDFTKGIPRNKVSITNGPAAGFGTYLGSIRSNGSAQIDWKMGTAAALGGEARLCVWNAYNRVVVSACVQDTTANWTYSSATQRPSNNSATNRISAVMGLNEDTVSARFAERMSGSGAAVFGIGLDSTSVFASKNSPALSLTQQLVSPFSGLLGLGFHYLQAIEVGDGVNTSTMYGLSATWQQHELSAELRM